MINTTAGRTEQNPDSDPSKDPWRALPPQTEGPTIKTAFVTTDTIRLDIRTIEALQKLADLGSSWDDVILKLLNSYYNKNR
jgi:hypothetical protein